MDIDWTIDTLPRLIQGLVFGSTLLLGVGAQAMDLVVVGNTMVLSGPVTGTELSTVKAACEQSQDRAGGPSQFVWRPCRDGLPGG